MTKVSNMDWDGYARTSYDSVLLLRAYNAMLNDIWFRTQVTQSQHVLDLGCGSGNLARKMLDTGSVVTGYDSSEAMLKIAKEKCAGLPSALHRGDITALENVAGEFDVVTLSNVLYAIPDPQRLLRNAFKCLRSGGRLIVSTPKLGFQIGEVLRFQDLTLGLDPAEWQNLHQDDARLRSCVRQAFPDQTESELIYQLAATNRDYIVSNRDFVFYTRDDLLETLNNMPWSDIDIETTYAGQNWLATLTK